MASVTKENDSQFWIANITLKDGKRTRRSTRKTDREEAQRLAEKWEEEGVIEVGKVAGGKVNVEKLALVSGVETVGGPGLIPESEPAPKSFEFPDDHGWAKEAIKWMDENWGKITGWVDRSRLINADVFVEKLVESAGKKETFVGWLKWWYAGNRGRLFEYPYLDADQWQARLRMELVKVVTGKSMKVAPVIVIKEVVKAQEFEPAPF